MRRRGDPDHISQPDGPLVRPSPAKREARARAVLAAGARRSWLRIMTMIISRDPWLDYPNQSPEQQAASRPTLSFKLENSRRRIGYYRRRVVSWR